MSERAELDLPAEDDARPERRRICPVCQHRRIVWARSERCAPCARVDCSRWRVAIEGTGLIQVVTATTAAEAAREALAVWGGALGRAWRLDVREVAG